ncbi:hypothetical protein VTJ49DRAFT_5726 [Mycothermus thermophilus]|uniref:Uncharacterized protein n=1 Tax=Humicola insolens TaxID=85995 RepID=A0ABR3VKN1_HUMIN
MRTGVSSYNSVFLVLFSAASPWPSLCIAAPWTGFLPRRSPVLDSNSPIPSAEEGPRLSASATRDSSILPAQIGGIAGAYAFSLVIVALVLLALSKKRREHLRNRDKPPEEEHVYFGFNPFPQPFLLQSEEEYQRQLQEFQKLTLQIPPTPSGARNFSYPSATPLSPTRAGAPLSPTKSQRSILAGPSPTSTILAAGIDLSVDQTVVHRDKAMAQQQLEEMYKYVMEAEQAKLEGREYQPPITSPSLRSVNQTQSPVKSALKKEKHKPSSLNLNRTDDRPQSRSSSMFSFLKSPKKNKATAMNISSPIMTPMSGTFPRGGHPQDQELSAMTPRHYYAPPAPPPVPGSTTDLPFRRAPSGPSASNQHLPTPDISPVSTQSIDSRIDAAIGNPPPNRAARREQRERERERESFDDRPRYSHSREVSSATPSPTGDAHEPYSAVSERSTSHLVSSGVGLPSSPRPSVTRFPSVSVDSLPASPRPHQASFRFPEVDPNALPGMSSSSSSSNGHAGNASTNDLPGNQNQTNNASTTSLRRPSTNAPSAVREGGVLPFRAFEPPTSPSGTSFATTTVKQTVFTRGPMSPGGPMTGGLPTGGLRSPWTGAPVPYTPYQPFSPVVPITPTVVTKADRKRMKRMEPKTPTVEMVKSEEEVW